MTAQMDKYLGPGNDDMSKMLNKPLDIDEMNKYK